MGRHAKDEIPTQLRIVADAGNMSEADKQAVTLACHKIKARLSQVRGICFIDDGALISLLIDGTVRVVDMREQNRP